MERLVILGGGESGVGTALLGKNKGFEVFVSDKGTIKEKYNTEIIPKLKEAFQYKNVFEVPKLEKIVLNMGLGEAVKSPKIIDFEAFLIFSRFT